MKLCALLTLVICFSCGKKAQEIIIPANQASSDEAQILEKALATIEEDFANLNVQVNLRTIPYRISTLETGVAGICITKPDGSPVAIAIDHSVFTNWGIETDEYYGFVYKVLLHEIGHCYFHRDHDNAWLEVPNMNFRINYYGNLYTLESKFQLSVMNTQGAPSVSKRIWPYYVKEVAGLDRVRRIEDIENYLDVWLEPTGP